MKQKLYQVDAFTDRVFSGNPAAVCPLMEWLDDSILQKIAMENNLAETAFYVKENDRFQIRWFTPEVEVDLCGHATLASAFVLFNLENYQEEVIQFYSPRSGDLTVSKKEDMLTLNFPADYYKETALAESLLACFTAKPLVAYKGKTDYLVEFENEQLIRELKPNLTAIAKLDARGLIVTSKGEEVDFVSRCFGPQVGVNEDPVTGSAHTTLIPYWANKFQKNSLTAIQCSARSGYLLGEYLGDRVEISGKCVLYLSGELYLD
ncbi:PhzF family phenazine biosynthesis protein [Sphingobacterium hungaricum]